MEVEYKSSIKARSKIIPDYPQMSQACPHKDSLAFEMKGGPQIPKTKVLSIMTHTQSRWYDARNQMVLNNPKVKNA